MHDAGALSDSTDRNRIGIETKSDSNRLGLESQSKSDRNRIGLESESNRNRIGIESDPHRNRNGIDAESAADRAEGRRGKVYDARAGDATAIFFLSKATQRDDHPAAAWRTSAAIHGVMSTAFWKHSFAAVVLPALQPVTPPKKRVWKPKAAQRQKQDWILKCL